MKTNRKNAREYLKRMKTVEEFTNFINSLMLTPEEKLIVKDIYINGLSHVQISMKYNISIEKSHKIIQKLLDKVT